MSTDHEEALIGCILVGADPRNTGITPGDLYQPRNGTIWAALLELREHGVQPDVQAVATHPGVDTMHVMDIYGRATVAGNADHYAQLVREAAARRRITQACVRAQQAADDGADPAATVDQLRADIDHVGTTATNTTTSLADLYQPVIDTILGGRSRGLSTPWPDLDRAIYGLQPGRLYVIAARPGVGKTVAALNLAIHMSIVHRRWTHFASLEMPKDELGFRCMANLSGVSLSTLSAGRNLPPADLASLEEARTNFGHLRIDVCDRSAQSLAMIRDGARRLAQHNQLGAVVVDYLQLMEAPGARRDATRAEVVGTFSRGLKNLAKDLQVPVIALSQLNRQGNQEEAPQLRDLRESGSIEQDADVVIMLHPDPKRTGEIQMVIRKNRGGPNDVTVQLEMWGHVAALRPPKTSSYRQITAA